VAGPAARRRNGAAFLLIGAVLLFAPNGYSWYFTWIVPLLCFYPSAAWLLLTVLQFLSYKIFINYRTLGDWQFDPLLPVALLCARLMSCWLGRFFAASRVLKKRPRLHVNRKRDVGSETGCGDISSDRRAVESRVRRGRGRLRGSAARVRRAGEFGSFGSGVVINFPRPRCRPGRPRQSAARICAMLGVSITQ